MPVGLHGLIPTTIGEGGRTEAEGSDLLKGQELRAEIYRLQEKAAMEPAPSTLGYYSHRWLLHDYRPLGTEPGGQLQPIQDGDTPATVDPSGPRPTTEGG